MSHATGGSPPPSCLFFMLHSMQHELDHEVKTAAVLKQVVDKRKTMNEKNVSTTLDNTTHDIQEARDDN